ncbi:MAG TPA: hypothetical protein VHJ20_24880 [Polyangia bacterium]|nr:hypothetical protein [Polyangia bacterium]
MRVRSLRLLLSAALLFVGACANQESTPGNGAGGKGAGGSTSTGGSTVSIGTGGAGASGGDTGVGGSTTPGNGGSTGTGGATATGGSSGTGGSTGTGGAGVAIPVGGSGGGGTTGSTGAGGGDEPPTRPINITPGGGCNCDLNVGGGKLGVDTRKPIQGKLVLTLGGICGGPGGGGLEGTAKALGFHVWQPPTQTCVNSAPQKYLDAIAKNPDDPEANRQVGDARMELWDGVDRVDWVTVNKGESIVERTEAALKAGVQQDQGGDWGYFLDANGHVRWSDVYVVGYSWGSQTIAMVSSYVRFGRVICTSGPQAERFPNATWITHPAATPPERKFMAVGFNLPYPSTDPTDIAPNTVTSMIDTVTKAGWIGPPVNVLPGDTGPYTGKHMFAMVAKFPYSAHAPGGHGIFCNNDPMSGWAAACSYLFLDK